MTRKPPRPLHPEIPDAVLLGTERSRLFWLLYKHHDVLAARWKIHRASWDAVCKWAETEQAWDKSGQPAKPGAARKTWDRVRALRARENAEASRHEAP